MVSKADGTNDDGMEFQAVRRVDLTKSQYDLDTYFGHAKQFFSVANPRLAFKSKETLLQSRDIVLCHEQGKAPSTMTETELLEAKRLFDSAFHPQTKEMQVMIGRMSFQVWGNMFITGAMMTFYRTTPSVVFWQWINQSFNAVVNYTNRNASNPISKKNLAMAYFGATEAATVTALGLNFTIKRKPTLAMGIVGRIVPFFAVAATNCINIPAMRRSEFVNGIELSDTSGRPILDSSGQSVTSKKSATKAIFLVTFSRILMAIPGMFIPPIVASRLECKGVFKRIPWLSLPLQAALCGLWFVKISLHYATAYCPTNLRSRELVVFTICLVFATPLACAIFPQTSSVAVDDLEEDCQSAFRSVGYSAQYVYFKKGL